jgi:hypothetical protein
MALLVLQRTVCFQIVRGHCGGRSQGLGRSWNENCSNGWRLQRNTVSPLWADKNTIIHAMAGGFHVLHKVSFVPPRSSDAPKSRMANTRTLLAGCRNHHFTKRWATFGGCHRIFSVSSQAIVSSLVPGVVWAFQGSSHSGKTIRYFPRLEPALVASRTGQRSTAPAEITGNSRNTPRFPLFPKFQEQETIATKNHSASPPTGWWGMRHAPSPLSGLRRDEASSCRRFLLAGWGLTNRPDC